jgi:hypothetical protein
MLPITHGKINAILAANDAVTTMTEGAFGGK